MKLRTLATCAVALGAMAVPATASAAKDKEVTVMSRNLYLGADLNPAVGAADIPSAIDGAGVVYNQLVATDYPQRVVALAGEIKREKPDLVGLQEVALWHEQIPSDLGGPPIGPGTIPASTVKYDFLQLLEDQLAVQGAKYKVVGTQQEFTGELPADVNGVNEQGTVAGEDLDIRLTMRDVILAKKGVKTSGFKSANYVNAYQTDISGIPVTADRGWTSVNAEVGNAKFRFVNTHLESFDDGTIREAQAEELLKTGLKGKKTSVLVGDLNSDPRDKSNDGLAYDAFEKAGYGRRVVNGNTFGHTANVNDPNDASEFVLQIDHVLVNDPKIKLDKKGSTLLGKKTSEMTAGGLWPSDHAGVVSSLVFP
ncbi:MAG: endonuclease/exonuclease/phosphatase family protein [Solirubrobacterales bacterium]